MTPADGTNRISPEISITKASTRSNASRPSASSGSLFRASTYVPYSALIHPQGGNLFGSVTTSTPFAGSAPRGVTPSPSEEKDPFQQFITLQTFERFYGFDAKMLKLTGVSFGQHRVLEDLHLRLWATILVMSILKRKISDEKGACAGDDDGEKAQGWWKWAGELIEAKGERVVEEVVPILVHA